MNLEKFFKNNILLDFKEFRNLYYIGIAWKNGDRDFDYIRVSKRDFNILKECVSYE